MNAKTLNHFINKILAQTEHPAIDVFEAENCLLTLDRSLSPGGDRKLKDARVQMTGWPNPGVYRIPQLAMRILLQLERKNLTRLRFPILSPLDIMRELAKLYPTTRPWRLFSFQQNFKYLFPSSISLERWPDVLRSYELGKNPELKDATEQIIAYLRLRAEAAQHKFWLSEWQAVEAVLSVRNALSSLGPEDWTQILERDPRSESPLRIIVIENRDPYALEESFLRLWSEKIGQNFPQLLRIPIAESESVDFTNIPQSDLKDKTGLAIFWAYPESLPTAAEIAEWIPGDQALDLPYDELRSHSPEIRELYLFAQYRRLACPSKHPWLFSKKSSRLRLTADFSVADCWQALEKLWERSEARPAPLPDGPKDFQSLEDWCRIFLELGLLREARETPPHQRFHANGIPVLSIHDFAFLPNENIALWAKPESLRALCDPFHAQSSRLNLLPPQLEDCFEAEGISLPKPAREMRKLATLIQAFQNDVFFIRIPLEKPQIDTQEAIQLLPYEKECPSPTALESYLNCGLRFYLERVLRLQEATVVDPERMPENLRGDWIHRVLESFLPRKIFHDTRANLYQELAEKLDHVFKNGVSPAYKQLLLKQAGPLSEKLARHLEGFEKELYQIAATREVRTEVWVEGAYKGQKFRGKVDRIDLLPSGEILLWDYKTGRMEGRFERLLEHNHLQWLLYRQLIEDLPEFQGRRIIGGGYLNPLAPEKSRLLILPEASLGSALNEIADRYGHKVEICTSDYLNTLNEALDAKIQKALNGLKSGSYDAKPFKDAQCRYCRVQGFCGRPYLLEAATTEEKFEETLQ